MDEKWRILRQKRIRKLMKEQYKTIAPYVEHNEQGYIISIEGRGEELLYQENGNGVMIYIDPINAVINKKSIDFWDDFSLISEVEKDVIIKRVISYFKKFHGKDAVIMDS